MDHFVSHTALLVCAHRVHESRRADALFKDPVAELMVPEVRAPSCVVNRGKLCILYIYILYICMRECG
jgi:O-methyltransferase involved in polyketide biosynthesis